MYVNQPTNVTSEATGDGILTVSWINAQTTHQFNKVEYRNVTSSGAWTTASATVSASDTSYAISGLTAVNEYDARVTALSANAFVAQVETLTLTKDERDVEAYDITCVADVADSLDGTYFRLYDLSGSVGFWIDVDDSGTTIPSGASGADRAVEITGIATGDTAATVASVVAAAINADAQFSASASVADVSVTAATGGALVDPSIGDTGFTLTMTTQGSDTSNYDGKYYLTEDDDGLVCFWIDVDNSGTFQPSVTADRFVEITTVSANDSASDVLTAVSAAIHADSKYSASLLADDITVTNTDSGYRDTTPSTTIAGGSVVVATAGVDGDSDTVDANQTTFIRPNTEGIYYAADITDTITPTTWTHIITLTQSSPFLNGKASSISDTFNRTTSTIIPEDWRWGPELTIPAYTS